MAALFLTAKENLGGQKKPGFYKLLEFKQIGIIYAFHGITSYTYWDYNSNQYNAIYSYFFTQMIV